jgi:hypothetical protein
MLLILLGALLWLKLPLLPWLLLWLKQLKYRKSG